jgi:predicted acylesterase/phospholipase RssA
MAKRFFILSCDGGGIRGLLTALLIKKLDDECQFLKHVDLFAGTSSGGIISLGLAAGMPITKIIQLFRRNAKRIFEPRSPADFKLPELLSVILARLNPDLVKLLEQNYKYLYYVRYDNKGLLKVLGEIETDAVKNDKLLTDLPRKVLVTTFQLENKEAHEGWRPVALHNLGRPPIESHIIEAAMCTSAAPVYFPPYEHHQLGYCVDGGIFANNPGSLAAAMAINAGTELSALRLLSIGAGTTLNALPIPQAPLFNSVEAFGPSAWLLPVKTSDRAPAYPLLNALFDGSSANDSLVCHSLLRDSYLRVQVPLTTELPMDGVENKDLDVLNTVANGFSSSIKWKPIKDWVSKQLSN